MQALDQPWTRTRVHALITVTVIIVDATAQYAPMPHHIRSMLLSDPQRAVLVAENTAELPISCAEEMSSPLYGSLLHPPSATSTPGTPCTAPMQCCPPVTTPHLNPTLDRHHWPYYSGRTTSAQMVFSLSTSQIHVLSLFRGSHKSRTTIAGWLRSPELACARDLS